MVQTVETTRVYLNEKRQGVATCVHCGAKYPINMSNYTEHHLGTKALKVKCSSCKKIFHITYGSPIFKVVQKKWYPALYRALTKSPISPESAVGEGAERSHVDRSGVAP